MSSVQQVRRHRSRIAFAAAALAVSIVVPAPPSAAVEAAAGSWCPTLLVPSADGATASAALVPTDASYRVEVLGTVVVGQVELRFEHAGPEPVRAAWNATTPSGVELDAAVSIDGAGERTDLKLERAAVSGPRRGSAAARHAATRARAAAGASKATAAGQDRPTTGGSAGTLTLPAEGAVSIELSFHTAARFSDGRFTLSLPAIGGSCAAAGGRGATRVLSVPTDVLVTIRHDEPLVELDSPSHDVLHDFFGDRTEVEPVASDPRGDRAFELRYTLGRFDEPSLIGFSGPLVDGEQDVILVFAPAAHTSQESVRDKDVLFVVDTSGSMRGPKIDQARIAVSSSLDLLREHDRFNIVGFNSEVSRAFEQPAEVGPSAFDAAASWLAQRSSAGSTRLFPALTSTLQQEATPGNHRLVVLLTDGRVGDEAAATQFLDQNLGDARFFVVGIGDDADQDAIRRIAEHGLGAAAFASAPDQLSSALSELFAGVAEPVAWNLSLDWGGAEVLQMQPARLPDLYGGRPVTVRARVRGSLDAGVRIEAQTTSGVRSFDSTIGSGALPGRRGEAD